MTDKMGVAFPQVVDLVIHDSARQEWKLIVVETGPWHGLPELILKLQEKLNNYLHFALDGQMARLYPDSAGKRVVIQLDLYERPDDRTIEFITLARERLKTDGVGLYLNVVPDKTLRS